jgi:hypothetical protein
MDEEYALPIGGQAQKRQATAKTCSLQRSFAALERPADAGEFALADDTLSANGKSYDLAGRNLTDPRSG